MFLATIGQAFSSLDHHIAHTPKASLVICTSLIDQVFFYFILHRQPSAVSHHLSSIIHHPSSIHHPPYHHHYRHQCSYNFYSHSRPLQIMQQKIKKQKSKAKLNTKQNIDSKVELFWWIFIRHTVSIQEGMLEILSGDSHEKELKLVVCKVTKSISFFFFLM